MSTTPCKSIIHGKFFNPIFALLEQSRSRRACQVLPDHLWLEIGIRRCLGIFHSGRHFLQYLAECLDTNIGPSTFFESLKSKRRLKLVSELLRMQAASLDSTMPDPFTAFKALDEFDLYAGDGHFIAAASHDKPVNDTKYATGHLYTLNLRSHGMTHLSVADQSARRKEHDMRMLKRQTIDELRQGAATGRKVLYVWDRAGIDFRQWHRWKHEAGIYFLSREKDNMALSVMGENRVDSQERINEGVLADEIMGTSAGVSVRRVCFRDGETGTVYRFITNLPTTISPGLVALLYKSRWDIEKVFDEFKNKLAETKSWATTATAKTCQARLLCLAHNAMLSMEQSIVNQTGITNQAETKRKARRMARRDQEAKNQGLPGLAFIHRCIERFTQRSVKFVRWLNNHLDSPRSWEQAIDSLKRLYSRM